MIQYDLIGLSLNTHTEFNMTPHIAFLVPGVGMWSAANKKSTNEN